MSNIIKGKIIDIEAIVTEEKRSFIIGKTSVIKYIVHLDNNEKIETYNSLKKYNIGDEIAFFKGNDSPTTVVNKENVKQIIKSYKYMNIVRKSTIFTVWTFSLAQYVIATANFGPLSSGSLLMFCCLIAAALWHRSFNKEVKTNISMSDMAILKSYSKTEKENDVIDIKDLSRIKEIVK